MIQLNYLRIKVLVIVLFQECESQEKQTVFTMQAMVLNSDLVPNLNSLNVALHTVF